MSDELMSGATLTAPLTNGVYALTLGSDGNLVLTASGVPYWSTAPNGLPGATCSMRGSDLGIFASGTGTKLWDTGTSGYPGAFCILESNGNLVIYKSNGTTVLWQSNTHEAAHALAPLFAAKASAMATLAQIEEHTKLFAAQLFPKGSSQPAEALAFTPPHAPPTNGHSSLGSTAE